MIEILGHIVIYALITTTIVLIPTVIYVLIKSELENRAIVNAAKSRTAERKLARYSEKELIDSIVDVQDMEDKFERRARVRYKAVQQKW